MRVGFKKVSERTDEELLACYFKENDERALNRLISRYTNVVYGTCRYYIHHDEDAEDAMMEVFSLVMQELKKQPKINQFKPWLFIVTKNFCLRKLNKKSKILELFGHTSELDPNLFMQNETDLSLYERMDELYDKLYHCLDQLLPQQKICITLFYLKQKGYKEIAAELNLKPEIVRSNIQNGRRNLRKQLGVL